MRLRGKDLGGENVVREGYESEVKLGRERRRVGGREEENDVKEEGTSRSYGESVSIRVETEVHKPRMDREEEATEARSLAHTARNQTNARGTHKSNNCWHSSCLRTPLLRTSGAP